MNPKDCKTHGNSNDLRRLWAAYGILATVILVGGAGAVQLYGDVRSHDAQLNDIKVTLERIEDKLDDAIRK
jgi:hypothetical protein